MKEIEDKLTEEKFSVYDTNIKYLNNIVDLVLATNMISVGIDISRLNIMLLNGMPKNIAEYIQASSRVGRNTKGLVITLFDPNRAREKSYFENFKNFHQAFYKYVEPLSITPFTQNTINKMLSSIVVAYVRNKVSGMSGNKDVVNFTEDRLDELKDFISNRFSDSDDLEFFENEINKLSIDWKNKINNGIKFYKNKDFSLLKTSIESDETYPWRLMQSLREIDTNTYIQIKEDFVND